jgi:hypothetical protein
LFEKLFQNAHYDGVNANTRLFSPFPESGPGLGSDVQQLGRTEGQTRFTSLLDFHVFAINVAQSKKDDLSQIALDASLFRDGFSQFEGESEGHSGPIVCPPLAFPIHFPDFLLFGQPLFPFKDYALSFPERHSGVGSPEKQVLLNPHKEPVSRPDYDRRLDIQVAPCDLDPNLADLLSDRLPYLLPITGLRENRGILPLANLDSRSK